MTIGAAGPAYTVVVGMKNIPASVSIPIIKYFVSFADKRSSIRLDLMYLLKNGGKRPILLRSYD
jgi:hypothetical protein